MKKILALIIFALCVGANAGYVGLPTERMAIEDLEGDHLVCIWDQSEGEWISRESYDHSGVYEFDVPAWGQWYWIGLWDEAANEYAYTKWIGHFPTD
ncbi:MAG: hypothetical protein V5783_09730 [Pontiella sp.]